jgi:hypothetical protein
MGLAHLPARPAHQPEAAARFHVEGVGLVVLERPYLWVRRTQYRVLVRGGALPVSSLRPACQLLTVTFTLEL